MNFSTGEKPTSLTQPMGRLPKNGVNIGGRNNSVGDNTNVGYQLYAQNRQGIEGRIFRAEGDSTIDQIPNENLNLRINRVTSKEYKERHEKK